MWYSRRGALKRCWESPLAPTHTLLAAGLTKISTPGDTISANHRIFRTSHGHGKVHPDGPSRLKYVTHTCQQTPPWLWATAWPPPSHSDPPRSHPGLPRAVRPSVHACTQNCTRRRVAQRHRWPSRRHPMLPAHAMCTHARGGTRATARHARAAAVGGRLGLSDALGPARDGAVGAPWRRLGGGLAAPTPASARQPSVHEPRAAWEQRAGGRATAGREIFMSNRPAMSVRVQCACKARTSRGEVW